MFTGTVIGRVTRDLEIQHSAEKVPYIRFNLAVNKGYGENGHTIFPQCWVFGSENVNRLLRAKVGKGSLIQIGTSIWLSTGKSSTGWKPAKREASSRSWFGAGTMFRQENGRLPNRGETHPPYRRPPSKTLRWFPTTNRRFKNGHQKKEELQHHHAGWWR